MSFVRTDADLNVLAYPYSREQFQQDHQNVTLPEIPTQDQWAEYNVFPVRILPKSNYDSATQYCNLNATPHFSDGEWVLGWTISQKTEADLEADIFNWRQSASCSPFQGRMALADAGLLSQVDNIVALADEKTKVAWEYALEWKRQSPLIMTLASSLGLTEAQVDNLFIEAAKVTV